MTIRQVMASLDGVRQRIERARQRAGTSRDVTLVAVTKGHPLDVVRTALASGLRTLGENRVQELAAKVDAIGHADDDGPIEWHMIGHMQRNKVRQALPLFDLVHSVDSPRLARELSKEAQRADTVVRGLVQVNTSGEASKGGFEGEQALDRIAQVCELPGLRVHGLMTMAPLTGDEAVLRRTFGGARELWSRCDEQIAGFEARHLSMGMSNDFEIAVEEGSTMVRLGTILFGEREG